MLRQNPGLILPINVDSEALDCDRCCVLDCGKHFKVALSRGIPKRYFIEDGIRVHQIIVQGTLGEYRNDFSTELIKVNDVQEVLIFDNHSVVVEHEDIVVRPVKQIKKMLAFDKARVDALPVARYRHLVSESTLCFVLRDNNNTVCVKKFYFIRLFDINNFYFAECKPPN